MMMSLLSSRGKKRDEAKKMIKKTKKSFSVFHSLSSLSSLQNLSLSLLVCLCVRVCSDDVSEREREESVVVLLCAPFSRARFSREMSVLRHAQLGFRV
jgi:hypothetical protein